MYRVVIYNGDESTIILEPTPDNAKPHLPSCQLVEGSSGEIDSVSFNIYPNNPGYDLLNSYSTMIEIIDTTTNPETSKFSGRVLSVAPQMEENGLVYKSVVCESRLGFLNDSVQPYVPKTTYYSDDDMTGAEKFLRLILDNHNAQVEDYKKIYIGTVLYTTSSGNVTKGLNYQTSWDAIREKLLNDVGGEIQLYAGDDGKLYLDYVNELGTDGEQTIELAKNMRSLTQDSSPTDIITRLIPLGDYIQEDESEDEESEEDTEIEERDPDDYERINISSVNDGKLYIDDEEAQEKYGIIVGTVVWEDVTEPENLLKKGQQWLEDQSVVDNITLTAYDLHVAGIDPYQIERYNYYRILNPLLGVDKYYRVTKVTTNICDPTDVTYTMGDQNLSLSSTLSKTGSDASSASDAAALINANLSKTVNTMIAANATILYLKAAVADIDTLYADVANINSLLAGNVGTGELQAIHITSDNVVIDDAVITDAMIGDLSASHLVAGTIYTDYVQIANNEGQQLWIDGSTIQITDENGIIRVQIGEDGEGDYNLYLWDATGTLIWNAYGLTEDGLVGNGAIIKNDAVADDAAISGYKLDIDSVTSCLNEYGGLVVDAAQVTINGTTLSAAYTEIQTSIANMGDVTVVKWYAINDTDEYPPCEPGEFTTCVIDDFLADEAVCDVDSWEYWWTTERPVATAGEFLWFCEQIISGNGDISYTEPTCVTDGYIWDETRTLVTSLEVLQGQIDGKVWQTDIDTAVGNLGDTITVLSDNFSELTLQVNSITSTVESLQTTQTEDYMEMLTRIAEISQTITDTEASILLQVSETYITSEDAAENYATKASLVLYIDEDGIAKLSANADCIYLTGGQLVIDSDGFTLDADGNATFSGSLNAATGTFSGTLKSCDIDTTSIRIDSGINYYSATIVITDQIWTADGWLDTMSSTEWSGAYQAIYLRINNYSDDTRAMMVLSEGGTCSVLASKGFYVLSSGGNTGSMYVKNITLMTSGNPSGSITLYGTLTVSGTTTLNSTTHIYNSALFIHDQGIALGNNYGVFHYLKNGSTYVKLEYVSTSDVFYIGNASYDTILTGANVYLKSTSTTVTSDARLKTDFGAVNNYDAVFDALQPLTYRFKRGGGIHLGFTYQDMMTALESAGINTDDSALVSTYLDDETNMEIGGIAYTELIALLVYEVQSLKQELAEIKLAQAAN